jgi:hypothetical protein
MAQRRVPVERMRSSTALQTVAAPVETYVRPPELPEQESELGAFIRAVAPAVETVAKLEYEKKVKQKREVEKGIASARAFDARLGASQALSAAFDDFADPANTQEYLEMTPEKVRDRRAAIMQPFIDKVAQSGDEQLAQAFQQDLELGNLTFFTQSFNPKQREYQLNNKLDEVFTEALAINNRQMMLPTNQFAVQASPTQLQQRIQQLRDEATDELLTTFQSAYDIPWDTINAYAVEIARNTVGDTGRNNIYRWLDRSKQLGVSKYSKDVAIINNTLDARDKEILKAQEPLYFQQQVMANVEKHMETGFWSDLGVDQPLVGPAGGKFTIKDSDVVSAYETIAQRDGISRVAQMDWFRTTGLIPSINRNAIMSGKNFWASGDLTDATKAKNAAAAFYAVEELMAYNIEIPENLLSTDQKKLFDVISILNRDAGVGKDIVEDIGLAQSVNFDLAPSTKLKEKAQSQLNQFSPLSTDHSESINNAANALEIANTASIFMQLGYSEDDALDRAATIFEADHVIHNLSNGVKISLKQLNTDPNVTVPLVETVDTISNLLSQSSALQNYLKINYAAADDGDLAFGFSNDPLNRNALRLNVYNGSGQVVGFIQTVSKTQLLTDENFVTNLMSQIKTEARNANLDLNQPPPVDQSILDYEVQVSQMTEQERRAEARLQAARLGEDVPELISEFFPVVEPTVEEPQAPVVQDEMLSPEDMMTQQPESTESILSIIGRAFTGEQDYTKDPQSVIGNIQRVLPLISQSEEGVGTFFDEAYEDTKKQYTNLSAIKEAKRLLAGSPEILDELGLNEKGLFGPAVSGRGITVKQQAEIARSIIAVANASEKQYDLETEANLTEALDLAATQKGISPDDILNKVIKPIAYHESDGTLDANIQQYGGGPARGLMQFEPERFNTAINRAKNYFARIGQPVPEWIMNIPEGSDASDLSGNQQMALAVYDLLEHPTADIAKVVNGEEKIWDFWAKNWWAGDPKDRVTRIRSFQKSLNEYEKTLPTANDDTAMISPTEESGSLGTQVASFMKSLSPIKSANADVFDAVEEAFIEVPVRTPMQADEVTTNVVKTITPVANTNAVPEDQQLVVGKEAPAEMVGDMILSKNPADVAMRYLGMSEDSEIGAMVIRRYFDNVVGDWNPNNESVKDFAKNKAWCAAFLTQVLRDSGVDTKELTGSDDPFNQIRAASYVNAGTGVEPTQAQTGDIMVKMHSPEEREKFKLGVAHVGIVVKVEGNQVWFIGGNTGDKVEISSYNLDEADVRIRRVTKAEDIPEAQNVPWLWQLRAGKAYRKSYDKLTNFFG